MLETDGGAQGSWRHGLFTGTTIEELLSMVERAENNAATQIRLQQEIRMVPVVPVFEQVCFEQPTVMVGVA